MRRLVPLFILLVAIIAPLPVAARTPAKKAQPSGDAAKTARPAQGCDLYLIMARSAVPSRERNFALRALKGCPASPTIARILERAIATDDYAARSAALESLETHLDRASVPFLVGLYNQVGSGELDDENEVHVFEYLSGLATANGNAASPARKTQRVPARIFRRGLYHPHSRIRQASLRGLGRLDDAADWPLIRAALIQAPTTGEHIAALQAARQMRFRDSGDSLDAARRALGLDTKVPGAPENSRDSRNSGIGAATRKAGRPDPGLERAAIELLGSLSGPRAFESLLVYRVLQADGPNQALLQKTIANGWNPKRNYAYARTPARLHAQATDRSEIRAVVAPHTILYIEESTGLGYRLPPAEGRSQPEANWLRVRTTSGLAGWVHASRTRRLTPDS